jgi:hypothetical protein
MRVGSKDRAFLFEAEPKDYGGAREDQIYVR